MPYTPPPPYPHDASQPLFCDLIASDGNGRAAGPPLGNAIRAHTKGGAIVFTGRAHEALAALEELALDRTF